MEIRRRSIRAKLTLLLLLVGVGPLTLGSLYSYSSTRAGMLYAARAQMEQEAAEVTHALGMLFTQARTNLLLTAANPAFSRHLTDPANKELWLQEQERAFLLLDGLFPGLLDEACYMDPRGQEISRMVSGNIERGNNLSGEESRYRFFRKTLEHPGGRVFQGLPTFSLDTGRLVVPNAVPVVLGSGRKIGLVHFEMSLEGVRRILQQFDPPAGGYLVLLDDRGRVLVHTAGSGALSNRTAEFLTKAGSSPLTRETQPSYFTYGNHHYYLIFRPLPRSPDNENRWVLAYALSAEQVFGQATPLSYILVLAGGTLGALFLAWIVGSRFTRPIHQLREGVRRIGLGHLDARLDLHTRDELEEVAVEFNAMAQELKDLYEGLEDKIERRTRDLSRTQRVLRSLLQKVIGAQEDERKRLARELHDETSQALSTLLLNLEMMDKELGAGQEKRARKRAQSLKDLVDQTLDSLQLLIHNLRPSLLDDLGVVAALRWYALRYQERTGIQVSLEAAAEPRLPPEVETALYRIVQESLTNIARHSGAKSASVKVICDTGSCRLAVEDNGRGFDAAALGHSVEGGHRGGFGLMGIEERVSLLGGTMTVDSGLGKGTILHVEFPLLREEAIND